MKNFKLKILFSFALGVMMIGALAAPISAASGYSIKFLAGSQGTFTGGATHETETLAYGESSSPDVHVGNLTVKTGYYFNGWNYTVKNPVTKSATYVAQYKRIVNEGVYRVKYVDTDGNDLATQKVVTSEVGVVVSENAIAIDGYAADAYNKTAKVTKEGTDIVFTYTSTTTSTGVKTKTINNVVVVATTTGGTGTGGTTGTNTAGGTGGRGTEEVQENTTPQTNGGQTASVEDSQTAVGTIGQHWALVNLIAAVASVILSVLTFILKKKEEKNTNIQKAANIFLGAGAVVLFFVTENLAKSMVYVDSYTVVAVAIAAVQIIILAVKNKPDSDNQKLLHE